MANCAAKIHGLFRIGGEIMQDSLLARVGEAVWGWPMMALFLGTGIWSMLRLRGLPLRAVAELAKSWCFEEATLGVAALNAYYAQKPLLDPLGAVYDPPVERSERGSRGGVPPRDAFEQYRPRIEAAGEARGGDGRALAEVVLHPLGFVLEPAQAHDDAALRKGFSVVGVQIAVAGLHAAAMNIYGYGKLLRIRLRRSPDIQIEAILTHRKINHIELLSCQRIAASFRGKSSLHGDRSELMAEKNSVPVLRGLRSLPAKIANRRFRERNSLEDTDGLIPGGKTFYNAVFCFHL